MKSFTTKMSFYCVPCELNRLNLKKPRKKYFYQFFQSTVNDSLKFKILLALK